MKKRALLVGINNYSRTGTLDNLRYARQDAESVASALQTCYGFTENEITLMTCQKTGALSPSTPSAILNQLSSELYSDPLDLFIFGFWGHSIWNNDTRYFCPMSTIQKDLDGSCLEVGKVFRRVADLPIRNSCFVLDCCQTSMGRDIGLSGKYKSATSNDWERNVAILNSCSPGEIAYEWDDRQHGIFTAHLLEAMKKRLDTVDKWASYVKDTVSQTAVQLGKNSQTPHYSYQGNIELPVVKGEPVIDRQSYTISESTLSQSVIQDALLRLINLLQNSEKLYEQPVIAEMARKQKEQILSLHEAVKNRAIDASTAYNRLRTLAFQTGKWIKENRLLLGSKQNPFVSYEWFRWDKFAHDNQLEEISEALNPR